MSDRTSPTDERIAAMLETRAGTAVPEGLDVRIRAAVRADASRRGRRWWWSRGDRRTTPTLVLVGLLLVTGLAASWVVGSRAPATLMGPVVSPSPSPVVSPCPEMDPVLQATDIGTGPLPMSRPAPGRPGNGALVLMAGGDSIELSVVDPVHPTAPRPITHWQLDGLPVTSIVPSPDGSTLAVSLYLHGGCSDVLIVRSDGSAARHPFPYGLTHNVFGPAWSPDGTRLAVGHDSWIPGDTDLSRADAGSVLLWDPVTGDVEDLGAPCSGCGVNYGPVWSVDGSRLAVTYTGGFCGHRISQLPGELAALVAAAASFQPACDRPGLAILDRDGHWRLLPGPVVPETWEVMNLTGWLDERTLLLEDGRTSGVRLDVDSGSSTPVAVPGGSILSPDRRRVAALEIGDRSAIDVVDLDTGRSTSIPAVLPDILGIAWSPDSTSIAFQAASANGDDRGIFIALADGSGSPVRALDGGFGVMAWSPRVADPLPSRSP